MFFPPWFVCLGVKNPPQGKTSRRKTNDIRYKKHIVFMTKINIKM